MTNLFQKQEEAMSKVGTINRNIFNNQVIVASGLTPSDPTTEQAIKDKLTKDSKELEDIKNTEEGIALSQQQIGEEDKAKEQEALDKIKEGKTIEQDVTEFIPNTLPNSLTFTGDSKVNKAVSISTGEPSLQSPAEIIGNNILQSTHIPVIDNKPIMDTQAAIDAIDKPVLDEPTISGEDNKKEETSNTTSLNKITSKTYDSGIPNTPSKRKTNQLYDHYFTASDVNIFLTNPLNNKTLQVDKAMGIGWSHSLSSSPVYTIGNRDPAFFSQGNSVVQGSLDIAFKSVDYMRYAINYLKDVDAIKDRLAELSDKVDNDSITGDEVGELLTLRESDKIQVYSPSIVNFNIPLNITISFDNSNYTSSVYETSDITLYGVKIQGQQMAIHTADEHILVDKYTFLAKNVS